MSGSSYPVAPKTIILPKKAMQAQSTPPHVSASASTQTPQTQTPQAQTQTQPQAQMQSPASMLVALPPVVQRPSHGGKSVQSRNPDLSLNQGQGQSQSQNKGRSSKKLPPRSLPDIPIPTRSRKKRAAPASASALSDPVPAANEELRKIEKGDVRRIPKEDLEDVNLGEIPDQDLRVVEIDQKLYVVWPDAIRLTGISKSKKLTEKEKVMLDSRAQLIVPVDALISVLKKETTNEVAQKLANFEFEKFVCDRPEPTTTSSSSSRTRRRAAPATPEKRKAKDVSAKRGGEKSRKKGDKHTNQKASAKADAGSGSDSDPDTGVDPQDPDASYDFGSDRELQSDDSGQEENGTAVSSDSSDDNDDDDNDDVRKPSHLYVPRNASVATPVISRHSQPRIPAERDKIDREILLNVSKALLRNTEIINDNHISLNKILSLYK